MLWKRERTTGVDKILCVWESGKCLRNAALKKWFSAGTWSMGRCHPGTEIGTQHRRVPPVGEGLVLPWFSNTVQGCWPGMWAGKTGPWLGRKAERNQIIRSFRSHVENGECCFKCNRKPLKDSKWRVGSSWFMHSERAPWLPPAWGQLVAGTEGSQWEVVPSMGDRWMGQMVEGELRSLGKGLWGAEAEGCVSGITVNTEHHWPRDLGLCY